MAEVSYETKLEIERRIDAIGKEIKAICKARGLEQADLAERSGVKLSTVQKIWQGLSVRPENLHAVLIALELELAVVEPSGLSSGAHGGQGVRVVTLQDLEKYMDNIRRGLITTAPLVILDLAMSWRVRLLFTADRFPALSVDNLEALSADCGAYLHTKDADGGGGSVLSVAVFMLSRAKAWLYHSGHPAPVQRALQALYCDLSAEASWLAFDAGDLALAERYLHETITHARLIDYHAAEFFALNVMCDLQFRLGQPELGLQAAERALHLASTATSSRVLAAFYIKGARARAYLGDKQGFVSDIRLAEKQLGRGARGIPGFHWVIPEQLLWNRGLGRRTLGQRDLAVADLRLSTEKSTYCQRDDTRAKLGLAQTLAEGGDHSHAADVGLVELPKVMGMASAGCHQELHELYSLLKPQRPWTHPVREFIDAYDVAQARREAEQRAATHIA